MRPMFLKYVSGNGRSESVDWITLVNDAVVFFLYSYNFLPVCGNSQYELSGPYSPT